MRNNKKFVHGVTWTFAGVALITISLLAPTQIVPLTATIMASIIAALIIQGLNS